MACIAKLYLAKCFALFPSVFFDSMVNLSTYKFSAWNQLQYFKINGLEKRGLKVNNAAMFSVIPDFTVCG